MKARNRFELGGRVAERAEQRVQTLLSMLWCQDNKVPMTTVNITKAVEYTGFGETAERLLSRDVTKTEIQRVRRALRQWCWDGFLVRVGFRKTAEWAFTKHGHDLMSSLSGPDL